MARKTIADIRKEEIVKAFFKVASEKGLAKATIREVARAAGCNHGILHHYFAGKKQILKGAMDYVTTVYKAELLDGLSECDSAMSRIGYLISWFLDLSRFNLEFSRAWTEFVNLSKYDPAASATVRGLYEEMKGVFAETIREGIRSGEFRKLNPIVMANVIAANVEGSLLLWVAEPEKTPIKEMAKQIEDMITKYLGNHESRLNKERSDKDRGGRDMR
ncbi:MAG: TetR/AcrR family transcriptional regulator [Candidatus Lindowbacteria bacterium]|nr:TetR/AcrR family transcriptional regulator [Candidatus Lindowbacteria bacterium]